MWLSLSIWRIQVSCAWMRNVAVGSNHNGVRRQLAQPAINTKTCCSQLDHSLCSACIDTTLSYLVSVDHEALVWKALATNQLNGQWPAGPHVPPGPLPPSLKRPIYPRWVKQKSVAVDLSSWPGLAMWASSDKLPSLPPMPCGARDAPYRSRWFV